MVIESMLSTLVRLNLVDRKSWRGVVLYNTCSAIATAEVKVELDLFDIKWVYLSICYPCK